MHTQLSRSWLALRYQADGTVVAAASKDTVVKDPGVYKNTATRVALLQALLSCCQ